LVPPNPLVCLMSYMDDPSRPRNLTARRRTAPTPKSVGPVPPLRATFRLGMVLSGPIVRPSRRAANARLWCHLLPLSVKPGRLLAQALERAMENLGGIPYTDHLESPQKALQVSRQEDDWVSFDLAGVSCPPSSAKTQGLLSAICVLDCVITFVNNRVV
jgi:hypothetical protein